MGTALALGLAIGASLLLSFLGSSWATLQAKDTRGRYLPENKAWVDAALAGEQATMLVVGQPSEAPPLTTLFWNPSIRSVVRAPGAKRIANVLTPEVSVDANGTVRVEGSPLTGPVVEASDGQASLSFANARRVEGGGSTALFSPRGPLRLAALMTGRLADGRVLAHGAITVWRPGKRLAGWIELAVTVPTAVPRSTVVVRSVDRHRASATVEPGAAVTLRIAACTSKPWHGTVTTSPVGPNGGGWMSALLSQPRYVADPRACS